MAEKKYDIFISYRSKDGAQYARILQLELEKYNYRVFLDYDELTDGVFGTDRLPSRADKPFRGTVKIWDFSPFQQLIDQTRERFKDRPLTAEERRMYYLE